MKIMKEVTVAIAISGGKYLTAVNRGGMGEKENLLSIHTDAKAIGPWEEFSFEKCDDTHVAIKTGSGKYLSIKSNNNTDPGNAFLFIQMQFGFVNGSVLHYVILKMENMH